MMLKRPARLHADVLMVLEGICEGAQREGEEGQGNGEMSAPTILGVCPRIRKVEGTERTEPAHNVLCQRATGPTFLSKTCCCRRACANGWMKTTWCTSSAMSWTSLICQRSTRCTSRRSEGNRRTIRA